MGDRIRVLRSGKATPGGPMSTSSGTVYLVPVQPDGWIEMEPWVDYVGPDGRGLGVYFPGSPQLTTYRYQGQPGPKGGGCSYFAPVRTMQIKPGFVHDYTIHLTIGTADEMRARFGALRKEAPAGKAPAKP